MSWAIVGVVFVCLGARLLFLARREPGSPEAMLGIFLVGMGIGLPALRVGSVAGAVDADWMRALLFTGQLAVAVATSAIAVFAWLAFDEGSVWRRVLAGTFVAGQALVLVALGVQTGFGPDPAPMNLVASVWRAAVLAWVLAETLQHGRVMRRRALHGLEDPLSANRCTLWAAGYGCVSGIAVAGVCVRIQQTSGGVSQAASAEMLTVLGPLIALLASSAVLSFFLACFPPAAYRRWVERRVEVETGRAVQSA